MKFNEFRNLKVHLFYINPWIEHASPESRLGPGFLTCSQSQFQLMVTFNDQMATKGNFLPIFYYNFLHEPLAEQVWCCSKGQEFQKCYNFESGLTLQL